MSKECMGWPMGVKCDGVPDVNPRWCNPCNLKRVEHISKRMEALAERFK